MLPYWIVFSFAIVWMGLIALQESDEFGRIPTLRFATRWLFVAILSLFVGVYSENGSLDYQNYVDFLIETPPVAEWGLSSLKDPFFQSLGLAFASHDGNLGTLTFVTTFLSLGIKMKILDSRYYENVFSLAMIFLIGRFFLLHEFTQIRASLGIAFISLSILGAIEKKWLLVLTGIVVAVFTHLSTIAMLPVVLLACNTTVKVKLILLFLLIPLFLVIGVGVEVENFSRLEPYLTGDHLVTENTLISFYFLFKTLVLVILLFQWTSLNSGMRCALMVSAYGLLLTLAFIQNNVLSLRLGELTAVFDCICFAYFLKYSYKLELFYAYVAGLVVAALLYFSSTNIVYPISLNF